MCRICVELLRIQRSLVPTHDGRIGLFRILRKKLHGCPAERSYPTWHRAVEFASLAHDECRLYFSGSTLAVRVVFAARRIGIDDYRLGAEVALSKAADVSGSCNAVVHHRYGVGLWSKNVASSVFQIGFCNCLSVFCHCTRCFLFRRNSQRAD